MFSDDVDDKVDTAVDKLKLQPSIVWRKFMKKFCSNIKQSVSNYVDCITFILRKT